MAFNNLLDDFKRKRKFTKLRKKRLHLWNLESDKICYIQNYKVATRSIRLALTRYLLESEIGKQVVDYDAISNEQVEEKDEATKAFRFASGIRDLCPDHFVFTFVRHPLTRIQSCYTNQLLDVTNAGEKNRFAIYGIHPEMSFERFVEIIAGIPDKHADRHFRSQHYLTHDGDQSVCDFIGKFETLGDDWKQLQEQYDFPDLPHINKSLKRAPDEIELTPKIIQLVKDRYQRDFELYGYEI
jgi:hypothetical protein